MNKIQTLKLSAFLVLTFSLTLFADPVRVQLTADSKPQIVVIHGSRASYRVSVLPQTMSPLINSYTFSIERSDGSPLVGKGEQTYFCYDFRFPGVIRRRHGRPTLENCLDTQLTGSVWVEYQGNRISIRSGEKRVAWAEDRDPIPVRSVSVDSQSRYAIHSGPERDRPRTMAASILPFPGLQ